MPIEFKNDIYIEVYDNEQGITIPVVCPSKSPTVNNINLSGLKTLIKNDDGIWGEESKRDMQNLLDEEPASKELITIGEIVLAPACAPEHYYHIEQKENNGKKYITVTRCERHSKFEKRAKVRKSAPTTSIKSKELHLESEPVTEQEKPKRKRRTKKEMEEFRASQKSEVIKPKKKSSKTQLDDFVDRRAVIDKKSRKQSELTVEDLNLEFFLCLKMKEALDEYINLKYPKQKKLLKSMHKQCVNRV